MAVKQAEHGIRGGEEVSVPACSFFYKNISPLLTAATSQVKAGEADGFGCEDGGGRGGDDG